MAVRMTKPWLPLTDAPSTLRGQMGVFQFADANENIIFIGYAGGKSLFGLRGEVQTVSEQLPEAALVRVEVTTSYLSRYRELLMAYVSDFGELPAANSDLPPGRLSPA